MKEPITGHYLLKCDRCDAYMEAPDGGSVVISDDELTDMLTASDWTECDGHHYCDNCSETTDSYEK